MINEVLKLVETGFTKDEILALTANAEPKKEEPKQEEPKQEEPKKEEPKQEEPKKEEPDANELAGLTDTMKELINTMRANAINTSNQKTPEDVENVLAKIINPNE